MTLVKQLLDYAATHPDAIITYHTSTMVLTGHRDTSYLSEEKSRSRAGGHFFMTDELEEPTNNEAVTKFLRIIKAVMLSAAFFELCALSINCREAVPTRNTLEEMGHKQPSTSIFYLQCCC